MNPDEAAELLGHCAAFDNRKPSAAAATAWAAALHDVPLDADAKAAVAAYYSTPPKDPDQRLWILPHHVRTLRTKIRSQRLEGFQYEPLPGETTPQYLARYRGQVQAVASGRAVVGLGGQPVLKGGPAPEVRAAIEAGGVGRTVPATDEEAAAAAARRAGPLGVVCPTCSAAVGRPCKTPGGTSKQPLGRPRVAPHGARRRAATGEPEQTPQQRAAAEERVRAASARTLTRLQAGDAIPDAEIVEDEEAAS